MLCIVHLIRRACDKFGALTQPQKNLILSVHAETTQVRFSEAFAKLRTSIPQDHADYLASVPLRLWALHTFLAEGIPLRGIKSSNQAEVVMALGRTLGFRLMDG